MQLYTAFDLHSNNSYLGIIDEDGKRVFKRKLSNDPEVILESLRLFRNDIVGIVVESTYNWYWLVDLLMAEGYKVHLANPAEIQKYSGLKYADDQHDAFWLAEMLRLGILPEGYIYPKEDLRSGTFCGSAGIWSDSGPRLSSVCRTLSAATTASS